MDQHEETWLVQLGSGAVRVMTLDELDAAFQEGTIDEDTFVRRDGASRWSRLRDELAASEPPPAPAPIVTFQAASYSVRPVVSEIDTSEFTDSPFAKKSRKGLFVGIGVAAAAAVAIGAFGATKLKDAPAADVNASVANAVQATPQVVTPPPPADPQPAAQKPALSEEQKKALADKDNQFNTKMDQKRKDRAKQLMNRPTHGKTQPPPFHKGGSAYDPLNAKL